MTYTFARVGTSAGKMHLENVYLRDRRTWVRPHEEIKSPRTLFQLANPGSE